MKVFIALCVLFSFMAFGFIMGAQSYHEPTTEECLSVCIEEFERMGC